jgi:DNA-binding transcriptional LysR family regulator
MNLADLEAFVAVAETGSVNRAAVRLRLTQPAVTRRVQNFEAAMGGAALLDRSSKPPGLTPAGRQALEYCRRVVAAVGDLKGSVSESGEPTGELCIGVAHGLADVLIASPLDDLRHRFPGLRLRVSGHWTASLMEEIRSGGLDCAIALMTEHQPLPPGVTAVDIGAERVVAVAAKDFKLTAKGHRLRIRDLGAHDWIVNTRGCGYREALQRAFDRAQSDLCISGEILGYDLQLSLIARHAGLGLIPLRRFNSSPHRRRLRILKIEDFTLDATAAMLRGRSLGSLGLAVDHLQVRVARALAHYNRSELS